VRTDRVVATPGLPQNCPILVCQRSAELFGAVRGKSTARIVPKARPIAPMTWAEWMENRSISSQEGACRVGSVARWGLESLSFHFYQCRPPRPLEEIEADIAELETEIVQILHEVVG